MKFFWSEEPASLSPFGGTAEEEMTVHTFAVCEERERGIVDTH